MRLLCGYSLLFCVSCTAGALVSQSDVESDDAVETIEPAVGADGQYFQFDYEAAEDGGVSEYRIVVTDDLEVDYWAFGSGETVDTDDEYDYFTGDLTVRGTALSADDLAAALQDMTDDPVPSLSGEPGNGYFGTYKLTLPDGSEFAWDDYSAPAELSDFLNYLDRVHWAVKHCSNIYDVDIVCGECLSFYNSWDGWGRGAIADVQERDACE